MSAFGTSATRCARRVECILFVLLWDDLGELHVQISDNRHRFRRPYGLLLHLVLQRRIFPCLAIRFFFGNACYVMSFQLAGRHAAHQVSKCRLFLRRVDVFG